MDAVPRRWLHLKFEAKAQMQEFLILNFLNWIYFFFFLYIYKKKGKIPHTFFRISLFVINFLSSCRVPVIPRWNFFRNSAFSLKVRGSHTREKASTK